MGFMSVKVHGTKEDVKKANLIANIIAGAVITVFFIIMAVVIL